MSCQTPGLLMSQNGKGDTYRPHDAERFGREYERIFRRPKDAPGSPAESPQPEPAPRPV